MTPFRAALFFPLSVVLIVLAGCGSSSSSSPTPTALPTVATAGPGTVTPTAVPLKPPAVTGSATAMINGNTVPLSELQLLLDLGARTSTAGTTIKQLTSNSFQQIIYNELIREYAVPHHILVSSAELDAQEKKDAKGNGGSIKAFEKLLATKYGLTVAQYRQIVAPNLLGSKVERIIAPLTPKHTDAQAHALAEKILRELQHGADFAKLARQYSEDTGSAAQGGDLGTVYPGQTVASFDHAAFHAPLKTYEIVKSQFGYHIVEVLSRGTGSPPAQQGAPTPKPGPTAHVRHILISTQPPTQQQQQLTFLTWLKAREKQATIVPLARVNGVKLTVPPPPA